MPHSCRTKCSSPAISGSGDARVISGVAVRAAPALAQEISLFGRRYGNGDHPANRRTFLNPGDVLRVTLLSDASDLTLFGNVTARTSAGS